MKIIQKLIIAASMTFVVYSAFANTITINPSKQQQIENWKFKSIDDGMIFLLGTYSKKTLTIHVNSTVANGSKADPVTVLCNASSGFTSHLVEAGSDITCIGDFNDFASMSIDPKDFKNGSEGTYEYKPITAK